MSKKDFIVGLDIGTTKICCIVGELSIPLHGNHIFEPSVDIVGIGTAPSTGLRKGVVVNMDATVESIRKAVDEAELMAGVKITEVITGIAGSHIKSFNSTGVVAIKDKEITRYDVERVIDAAKAVAIPQDREIIHVIPQEFQIDDQDGIRDPIGMTGVRLEAKVHIVTAAVSSAQNLVKCANRAGLQVREICLQPLASAEAVLHQDERELGAMLVDMGGGTTDFAIFKEGSVAYTGVLPIGGNHLTNDISVGLRTPIQEAEKLKTRFGSAMASLVQAEDTIEVPGVGGRKPRTVAKRHLAEIIEPRVEEVFTLLHQEVIKAGFQGMLSGGVVLTGGSVLLEGIPEVAEFILEVPTKRGLPYGLGGITDVVNSPKYATAVGLLKYSVRHQTRPRFQNRAEKMVDRIRRSMKGWVEEIF